MHLLKTFVSAWISAMAGVLSAMLIASLFVPHSFKLWVAVGIASGAAIANAIRAWRQISPDRYPWLVGCLVGAGGIIGTWFSGPG